MSHGLGGGNLCLSGWEGLDRVEWIEEWMSKLKLTLGFELV